MKPAGASNIPSFRALGRNRKGEILDYFEWEEHIEDLALLHYPEINNELFIAPLPETEAEALQRRLLDIPQLPIENEKSKVLNDADYDMVMALPANQRPRATDIAIEKMQDERRNRNLGTAAINADRKLTYENRVAQDVLKRSQRPKMAAWLLSEGIMLASTVEEIKADGKYHYGLRADEIFEITRRILGGISKLDVKMRLDLENALRALKQGTVPTHVYNTAFKRGLRKCVSAGSLISDADQIAIYVYGLNLEVYEDYIRQYAVDVDLVPKTIGEVMAHALAYHKRIVGVNPAMAKILDPSSKAFVAYAAEYDEKDDNEILNVVDAGLRNLSVTRCQLCDKPGHLAFKCWKLADAAYVQDVTSKASDDKMTRNAERRSKDKKKKSGSGANVSAVRVSESASKPLDFDPICLGEVVSEAFSICQCDELDGITTVNLEHDDHAEVSVLNKDAFHLLQSVSECNDHVTGVVPGAGVRITKRGMLKMDMGRAVVIPDASRILVSGAELRKSYDWSASHSEIRYRHKITGASIIFRLDPVRFGDHYFHTLFDANNGEYVASLDFYDPKPLEPVPPLDAHAVWPLIRAVERFHWNADHMSPEDMKRLCLRSDYVGEVTSEGVDLFVAHRGCSACLRGSMPAHSQLTSSRGLCDQVGEVAQGDIFFIDKDGVKLPVLIVVCEASLFMYLHLFEDAAARTSSRVMVKASEIQVALDAIIDLWSNAGHPLKVLRFDRDSAISASSVGEWLTSKGVQLVLNAAGHKLGLGEVVGRIVKHRCRSTLAGIKERFGYSYHPKWIPRLVCDVV